jgi:hypothetical protein
MPYNVLQLKAVAGIKQRNISGRKKLIEENNVDSRQLPQLILAAVRGS